MSKGAETFWKYAGPVIWALILVGMPLGYAMLDRRLIQIEDDTKYLIRMHMQTSKLEQRYDFTKTN